MDLSRIAGSSFAIAGEKLQQSILGKGARAKYKKSIPQGVSSRA
ncbi:MAG: hypothetical protein O4861_24830 [Trichodesmium sp. St16_bin4-tuft]|nr:hypothetical protein [Trichodesmium sp. St5_bin8]MDE5077624.1 hypothetical protein [Trichodesmium sp. St2_bin6]MDE5101376.1 hypothetical protein [Trichodesmium sp. St16_bin4-tuft]MDE5102151.1 hypothetical protein [Trichodesmium sp. St19_bin2]